MTCITLQHFPQPRFAAIANAIPISAEGQSHTLEYEEKQEKGGQPCGQMVPAAFCFEDGVTIRGTCLSRARMVVGMAHNGGHFR